MSSRPLMHDGLLLLSFVSLNPLPSDLIHRIFGICTAIVTMCVWIDCLLILILTYQGIDSILEVLIFLVYSQITMKMMFFLVNKEELITIINNTGIFWKPTSYDFEQQEENKKIFSFVKVSVRSYIVLLLSCCTVYSIRPLFDEEIVDLPWKSYCLEYYNYKICYSIEIFETLVLVVINLGFDALYICLITNIICEFKLLKVRLPNLKIKPMVRGTDKDAMDELGMLIDHHNLILESLRIFKHIYRIPLLALFTCNMFAICFSMIVLTSGTQDNTTKLQFILLMSFYLIQLSFYCISGSLLADESTSVAFEAYKAQWCVKTQPQLRNALLMVILRSNKPEIVTAGGFIDVNLVTFTVILKTCFSFYTFMQLMFEGSEEET